MVYLNEELDKVDSQMMSSPRTLMSNIITTSLQSPQQSYLEKYLSVVIFCLQRFAAPACSPLFRHAHYQCFFRDPALSRYADIQSRISTTCRQETSSYNSTWQFCNLR
jgi:hypothetical protein